MTVPLALIAEAEPLLAASLRALLATLWPELRLLPAASGEGGAIAHIEAVQPDIVFLALAMPGETSLAIAQACATLPCPPHIVFLIAYDRSVMAAFDALAADYLLTPIDSVRLDLMVKRLRERRVPPNVTSLHRVLSTLMNFNKIGVLRDLQGHVPLALAAEDVAVVGEGAASTWQKKSEIGAYLRSIRAYCGDEVHIVPLEDVCYFEAQGESVTVATPSGEFRIRTSLQTLLPLLDPSHFRQVRRSTLVNVADVMSVQHTQLGRMTIKLKRRKERLAVSRQYAHLLRQM